MPKVARRRVWSVLASCFLSCGVVSTAAAGSSAAACRGCSPGAVSAGMVMNQLNAVAAVSRFDVWAVGYSYDGSVYKTLIERWDGRSWQMWASPSPGDAGSVLSGVAAVSGTSAWAVGRATQGLVYSTLIEHWNGTKWSVQSSPNRAPGQNELKGVAAVSATDVWAVGTSGANQSTLIEHWDGSKWTVQASPSPGANINVLTSVAAISANNVWAVGYRTGGDTVSDTLIEHWNGTRWTVHASPSPGNHVNEFYGVAATGPSNIWAVGQTYNAGEQPSALIERWNGQDWTTQATPAAASTLSLHAAAAVSGTVAWAAGTTVGRTLAERWNGRAWQFQDTPDPIFSADPTLALNGTAALSASNTWAVGYSGEVYNPDSKTLIEHWNGQSWQVTPSPNRS